MVALRSLWPPLLFIQLGRAIFLLLLLLLPHHPPQHPLPLPPRRWSPPPRALVAIRQRTMVAPRGFVGVDAIRPDPNAERSAELTLQSNAKQHK